jgi:nitrate reductase NapE component
MNTGDDLMLTTYSFFQDVSYYTNLTKDLSASQATPEGHESMFNSSTNTCQLMFSWSNSSDMSANNITFGLPFFRQYGVGIDYVTQKLTFLNQTI